MKNLVILLILMALLLVGSSVMTAEEQVYCCWVTTDRAGRYGRPLPKDEHGGVQKTQRQRGKLLQ